MRTTTRNTPARDEAKLRPDSSTSPAHSSCSIEPTCPGGTSRVDYPNRRFRFAAYLRALVCTCLALAVCAACSSQAGGHATSPTASSVSAASAANDANANSSAYAGSSANGAEEKFLNASDKSASASAGTSEANMGSANISGAGGSASSPSASPTSSAVESKLASLSLEQKIAQMFIVTPESITGASVVVQAGEETAGALHDYPVSGFIYFGVNLEDAEQTGSMLAATQQYSQDAIGLPMFLCVDEEGGTVSRIGGEYGFSAENQGDMRDIGESGDVSKARDAANRIGTYLTNLGFTVDFAPVADIDNGTSDTMDQRAFGASGKAAAPMVAAQVDGFSSAGILCCTKHFPGIGSAEGDSHNSTIYSNRTIGELRQDELLPFRAAIDANVPFVMVGHIDLPNIEGSGLPASLSSKIMTNLLRNELSYKGLVITDSFGMGAITQRYDAGEAAVMAIEAGADIVLMPEDFYSAYNSVLDAVRSGRIPESRIDDSVRRVLQTKLAI